jgi:hypothetical protein
MNERLQIAEMVRQACIKVAIAAYEDAGLSGLCHEGQWEYAVDAIRRLELRPLLADPDTVRVNRRMKGSN